MRLPHVSGLVKDHLLKNLDPYFKAYDWNTFPASQLSQIRLTPDGGRAGAGSLFAFGLNYSLTGVFYNKTLAAKIGMTAPPTTLAQLDALLAKAKAAGHHADRAVQRRRDRRPAVPAAATDGGYGPPGPINNWIFDKPGATINTPSNLAATRICSSGSRPATSTRTPTRPTTRR